MAAILPTLNDKYNKEFFDELAEELEKDFPKGEKCPYCGNKAFARSRALLFNAYANIIFRQLLMKFGDEVITLCQEKK